MSDALLDALRKSYGEGYRPPQQEVQLKFDGATFHKSNCLKLKPSSATSSLEEFLTSEHPAHDCTDNMEFLPFEGSLPFDLAAVKSFNASKSFSKPLAQVNEITSVEALVTYHNQIVETLPQFRAGTLFYCFKLYQQSRGALPKDFSEAGDWIIKAFKNLMEVNSWKVFDFILAKEDKRTEGSGYLTLNDLICSPELEQAYKELQVRVKQEAFKKETFINFGDWSHSMLHDHVIHGEEFEGIVALLAGYYKTPGQRLAVVPFLVRGTLESNGYAKKLEKEEKKLLASTEMSQEDLATMAVLFEKGGLTLNECYRATLKLA